MTGPAADRAVDLRVRVGAVELRHPIVNASGTYEVAPLPSGAQCGEIDGPGGAGRLPFSAYFPKTITLRPRTGNPPPRITETAAGVINSIGLENPGVEGFVTDLERLRGLPAPVIVSVGGASPAEYRAVVEYLERYLDERPETSPAVAGYELNVSCPNVQDGTVIGADPRAVAALTEALRPLTDRLLIVKLTPNVADIVAPATAAEGAGADAVSLVNTFRATVLDRQTLRPFLGARVGGLCGPAIKPIALRMVAEVAASIAIPVVGLGGVTSGQDALEFIACGATLVGVGVAVFADPEAPRRIVEELAGGLLERGVRSPSEIRGIAWD